MKTTADATISVDQLTAKFKMWQLYTQLLETYARARIVYDLSHRVDGPLYVPVKIGDDQPCYWGVFIGIAPLPSINKIISSNLFYLFL